MADGVNENTSLIGLLRKLISYYLLVRLSLSLTHNDVSESNNVFPVFRSPRWSTEQPPVVRYSLVHLNGTRRYEFIVYRGAIKIAISRWLGFFFVRAARVCTAEHVTYCVRKIIRRPSRSPRFFIVSFPMIVYSHATRRFGASGLRRFGHLFTERKNKTVIKNTTRLLVKIYTQRYR